MYNVAISAVQQSGSVIHVHTSILFRILFPYRWSQNMIKQSHSWASIQRKPEFEKIHAPWGPLQHYLQ